MAYDLESSSEPHVKTSNNQEPTQTFYIRKRSNNKLKLVLVIGDKLNLDYISDSGENTSIKGILTTIDTNWIKVNETVILLDNIVHVSSLGTKRLGTIQAVVAAVVGFGLISSGVIMVAVGSQSKDWGNQVSLVRGGTAMTVVGTVIVVPLSMINLFKKLRRDKFSFHTFTN